MKRQVLFRSEVPETSGGVFRQPYLNPAHLFTRENDAGEVFWTCVRTRPRWEKKFAQWLRDGHWTYFLPVFPHETFSGNKRRVSEMPLFPGFVFVNGDWQKKDFIRTDSVVYVLRPRSPREAVQLHRELRNIWCGLSSGRYVTPVQNLATGEACRIVRGPMQGVDAKFERLGRKGRMILQVEIMGRGIAVEVSPGEIEIV